MAADLETLTTGEQAPTIVNAVVEVTVGSRSKYEYDPDLGAMVRDRVLPGSMRYPMDYGFIPSTRAADGEALDVLVAAYDPAFPGCVLRARPIGVLDLDDVSGHDQNVFAVPVDDFRFADIDHLEDLPRQTLREIEQFFTVYKRLEGDEHVAIRGWRGVAQAHRLVRDAMLT